MQSVQKTFIYFLFVVFIFVNLFSGNSTWISSSLSSCWSGRCLEFSNLVGPDFGVMPVSGLLFSLAQKEKKYTCSKTIEDTTLLVVSGKTRIASGWQIQKRIQKRIDYTNHDFFSILLWFQNPKTAKEPRQTSKFILEKSDSLISQKTQVLLQPPQTNFLFVF